MAKKAARSPDGAKHQAILNAATQLFLKHGYAKTTMDAVAARARVTKQTVYAHYKDKNSLFIQMIAAICHQHTPSPALLGNPNTPFETLLYQLGLALLELLSSPGGLGATRLVIAESEQYPKLAQLYYESGTLQLLRVLTHFLDQQNTRGVMHIPNTESAASYFIAMLKGQYYLKMILRLKPVPDEAQKRAHVKECVQIFMRIYGSPTPMKTRSTI